MGDQSQTVGGEGAIGVQIEGDGNHVTIVAGGAKLALMRLHAYRAEPKTIMELLRTDFRATELVGRARELNALAAWRAGPAAVAVRCITGRAGAGKTRLAIEACEAAEAEGWIAGFVGGDELARFHAAHDLFHWRLPRDALIVVDYAASSLAALDQWFALLAMHHDRPGGGTLRILLLERHADMAAGWWADLGRPGSRSRAGASDLIAGEPPVALEPLDAAADRRALLVETMRQAAPLLGKPAVAPPAAGADPDFDRRLADPRIDNEPLYLMMAAVHAVDHGAPAALALGKSALATAMAGIERRRIERFAGGRGFADGGEALVHLAACITLQNGCAVEDLAALIGEEAAAMGLTGAAGRGAVQAMADCLGGAGGAIDPIRPDLIGEAFVVATFDDKRLGPPEARGAIILRTHARAPAATDLLIRAACDLAEGSATHTTIRWLRLLVETSNDPEELIRIVESLPSETLALRELAADIVGKVVFYWRSAGLEDSEAATIGLARSLNNLAVRLGDLGQSEDALHAAQEATLLYDALATYRPNVFIPHLVHSLNNLANRLTDLGKREEALNSAQVAVTLCRRFAVAPLLAMSLNSLSNRLSALEQVEDALRAARESLQLYRVLATESPDIFTRDLAMSLNNLANRLGDCGHYEDALNTAQDAVALRRTLAARRPDAFTPDLAGSLNNLANRLSMLEYYEDALNTAQEAVTLRRALADQRPDAFTPDLAMSLNNFARHLNALGRQEDALDAAQEAVRLRRALAARRPDAFTPDLAGSLSNLAIILSALGQHESAIRAAEEAVALCRALVAGQPDAFTRNLATSLVVFANAAREFGHLSDAATSSREAVATLAPYFHAHPSIYGDRIVDYIDLYIDHAQAAGVATDFALIGPIIARLQAMNPSSEGSPE